LLVIYLLGQIDFFVNYLGIGDLESEAVEDKAKQIKLSPPPKVTPPPAKEAAPKKEPVYVEPRQFQELGRNGFWSLEVYE